MVTMNRRPTQDPYDERVDLEIVITPYARNAYQFLSQYLAPASTQHLRPSQNDVLALSARLKSYATFEVCVGLRDVAIPFRVEQGTLIKKGAFEDRTFASWQSFAAVRPSGQEGLELLGAFTQSLQSRQLESISPSSRQSSSVAFQWADLLTRGMPGVGGIIGQTFVQVFQNMASMYSEDINGGCCRETVPCGGRLSAISAGNRPRPHPRSSSVCATSTSPRSDRTCMPLPGRLAGAYRARTPPG